MVTGVGSNIFNKRTILQAYTIILTLENDLEQEFLPWTHTISQVSHSRVTVYLSVSQSPTMASEHLTLWGCDVKVTKQEDTVLYVSKVKRGKWQSRGIKKTAGV